MNQTGSIQIVDDPEALLTSSTDCLAKLWEKNGRPMGVLRQGGLKRGESWNFRLDVHEIGAKKLGEG